MKEAKINLLNKDDFRFTTVGKASSWALSVGRWIVIVTELIVITAFIARFDYDKKIQELSSAIEQQKVVVEAYQTIEQNFRQTQERISVVDQALSKQQNSNLLLEELGKAIPKDVVISNIIIDNEVLTIQAASLTNEGIAGLEKQLRDSEVFQDAYVTKIGIESRSDEGNQFQIEAKIAENI